MPDARPRAGLSRPDWPPVGERVLPRPDVPFPVTDEFVVRADLRRPAPGADADLLRLDDAWPRYAAAKLAALDADPDGFALVARGVDPAGTAPRGRAEVPTDASSTCPAATGALDPGAPGALAGVFDAMLARLAHAHPGVVAANERAGAATYAFPHAGLEVVPRAGEVRALVPASRPLAERLRALEPARRVLAAIAVSLQEDLALMTERDGELVAHALAVALPSGWRPREKLGRPLHAIHAPVAGGDALRAASAALARAMVEKGPFVRHVWTLADDDRFARPPLEGAPGRTAPRDVSELWFRCERQVTLPLPEWRSSLFLIRVLVAPLAEVAASAARRERLVRSLRSMSDEVVRYKGLAAARDVVLRAWGEGVR